MSDDISNKRNILASLMQRQPQQRQQQSDSISSSINRTATRPTSVLSNSSLTTMGSKQHKLSKRFTVIRKLGKGTYGKVQLAVNKETGQEVAIKTIKKSKIDNEEDMQRVRREIQIMRSIEHPHIIHIYEEFENKDKIVLIMQYAPGGELYEYVSQSKVLDDGEARRLFRQIATAIYYCHQNRICHRDLKLENILLDEKNNAKLADFGLSNLFDKQSQLKTFCGSPLYASPEIVQGSPYRGPEVDCWSLGVLLYTLVYGAMPFDGSNFKRLVKQISDASYFEPAEKSPASPLIRHLLCADPLKRATIIDICSDAWVNGATGTPLSPPTSTSPANKSTVAAAAAPSNEGQAQQHPSLLKVAQDMASLTPVRMDMLLALSAGEQAAREQREAAAAESSTARPPIADAVENKPPKRISPQQQRTLDPSTVMEVDEMRASSPIASYIVRDLDEPQPPNNEQPKPEAEAKKELKEDEDEVVEFSVEQDPIVVLEDNRDENSKETSIEILPPSVQDEPKIVHPELVEVVSAEPETSVEESKIVSIESASEIEHSSENKNQVDETVRMEVDQLPPPESVEPTAATGASVDQEAAPRPEEANVGEDKNESAPMTEAEQQRDENEDPNKKGPIPTQQQPGDGEEVPAKPKKVKKKIIVKKVKKKVPKQKDAAAAADDEADPQETAEQTNDKSNQDGDQTLAGKQQQPGETKQSINNKPGKVKIPDSFQAGELEQQQQQQVPSAPVSGRRQSALIADVSQKLLQSAAAETKTAAPTIIESDQLQLKNVRVSDKKEELERRASLAAQQAELQLVAQRSQSTSPCVVSAAAAEQQVEALQAELVREMQSSCAATESNPIQRLEPHSTGPAEPILAFIEEPSADKRLLQTPPGDERSDSLETIRAEDQAVSGADGHGHEKRRDDSVRSSLQVDLSPLREVGQAGMWQQNGRLPARSEQQQAPSGACGLAPIARSYKKVTFTRDGARITETGKIYSTKADDGTLRRVERKSKVTHYPAQSDGKVSRSSRSKLHEEELVYCDQSTGSSSSAIGPRKHHLERLIMPSQLMHGVESAADDSEDDGDLFACGSRQSSAAFSDPRQNFHGDHRQQQQQQQQQQHQQQQQQHDRRDSASSCSSGSTDVLEDIFDTWTGAISMFNRPSSRLFGRAAGRLSSESIGQRGQRRHRVSGSQAGTPRCESVEPQIGGGLKRTDSSQQQQQQQQQYRQQPAPGSGYESDAAGGSHQRRSHRRRPMAGPGSARGLFGSWNLLNDFNNNNNDNDDDDLFASFGQRHGHTKAPRDLFSASSGFDRNPFEILEQEQQSLRDRLAQQHKQLWKGSTPSLFDDFPSFGQQESVSGKPPVVKDPRLPTGHAPKAPGSATSSSHRVDQSHSSSSFKLQQSAGRQTAIPLEAALIRRNTTNFSPIVKKSTSSTQTTTHSFVQKPVADRKTEEQAATTFIQLKRTSSSLGSTTALVRSCSSKVKIHQLSTESGAKDETNSTSSSSCWNNRETPPIHATGSFDTHSTSETVPPKARTSDPSRQSPARESVDRRVQSWLQESGSGNLSATSSGSKVSSSQSASVSDHSLHSCRRAPDPFENLYGSLWQSSKNSSSSSRTKLMDMHAALPPQAAAAAPAVATSSTSRSSRSMAAVFQQTGRQADPSGGGVVVISTQKQQQQQSIIESSECPVDEKQMITMLIEKCRQAQSKREELRGDRTHHATSRTSSSIILQQQQARTGSPISPVLVESNETTAAAANNEEQQELRWVRQSVERASSRILSLGGDELEFDSLSGDLESRSSSSLLDQLKTKGYRSMINKRMIDVPDSAMAKSTSATKMIDETATLGQQGGATTTIVHQSSTHSSSRISKKPHQDDNDEAPRDLDECKASLNTTPKARPISPSPVTIGEPTDITNGNSNSADATGKQLADPTQPQMQASGGGPPEPSNDGAAAAAAAVVVQEEMDEDVREAKASIKCHLDRIKETELFLKSLKQDEENYELQRRQMSLFNDLLLGTTKTRLNGFNQKFAGNNNLMLDFSASNDSTSHHLGSNRDHPAGLRSAPVRSYRSCESNQLQETNKFFSVAPNLPSSEALSFEPTYVLPSSQQPRAAMSYGRSTVDYPMGNDPLLEPVQPLDYSFGCPYSPAASRYGQPTDRFRRSRSQLSDQFTDYKRRGGNASAESMVLQPEPEASPIVPTTNEIYYPSRAKRSLSQMRYSASNRLSQPVAMSEYRAAYGNPSLVGRADTGTGLIKSSEFELISGVEAGSKIQISGGDDDDDDGDDDGMNAYRASSYVPKVVPTTTTTIRGRSREKRSAQTTPTKFVEEDRSPRRQRRTSLQQVSSSAYSAAPTDEDAFSSPSRRRSLATVTGGGEHSQENSRLSELEQRIKENKRRREELLAGKSSPEPAASDSRTSSTLRKRRESSPAASPARTSASSNSAGGGGSALLGRPSRLESMEARIKRKSYCVRVADQVSPERAQLLRAGQMSLEKWRQTNPSGGLSSGANRQTHRADALMESSNLLLASISSKRRLASASNSASSRADDARRNSDSD